MEKIKLGNWQVIFLGIWLFFLLFFSFISLYSLVNSEEVFTVSIVTNPTPTSESTLKPTPTPSEKGANSNTDSNSNSETNANVNVNTDVNANLNEAITESENDKQEAKSKKLQNSTKENKGNKKSIPLLFNSIEVGFSGYLFLIVIFSGLLGGTIRVIFSFWYHLGIGDFSINWLPYYLALPFTGAGLSLVIFFVLRGGFFVGTPAGNSALNIYAFAALAALTGLFSDNTMAKLKKLAETLLEKSPPKTIQKPFKISTLNLSSPSISKLKETILTAKIVGGKAPYNYELSFDNEKLKTISGDAKTQDISIKIKKPHSITEKTDIKYELKVTDANKITIEKSGEKAIEVLVE